MRRFLSALLPVLVIGGLVLAGCDSGGGVPDDLGDSTSVGFVESTAALVEGEDETYALEITADDPGFEEVRLNLSVNASQSTAALGDDVTGLTGDTTVAFPRSATSGGTVSIPLTIVDEPVDSTGFLEDTESLAFTLSPADTLAPEIDDGASSFTLTIEEDDVPLTAEESRNRPSGGRTVADGLVTRVESDGVYVQDGTGAFFVFDGDFASQASKGDSVRVDGAVGYFNGVFQVSGVSDGPQTEVLSSGNALPAPQEVSLGEVVNNGEEYESELIRVENFAIDAGGDQTFQGGVPAGLYDISTQDASSTLLVTGGSGLVGESIPDRGTFQGVLGQFNGEGGGGDEPDEGYQLLGIDLDDVIAPEVATINEVRQESNGSSVSTAGVVTRVDGQNVFIQDESGPTGASGIVVRNGNLADDVRDGGIDPNPGDQIEVSGELGAFSGLLQISSNVQYSVIQTDAGLPSPQSVSAGDLLNGGGEDYESELITVSGLAIDDRGDSTFQGGTNYDATDSNGNTITLRISDNSFYAGQTIPSGAVAFEGVLSQFNGGFGGARGPDEGYQLLPLVDGDLSDTINQVRQESNGTSVFTLGVVTRVDGQNVFIQDESGPTGASGIVVRNGDLADDVRDGGIDPNPGDRIQVSGELGAFSGLLQISSNVQYTVDQTGVGLPSPQSVSVSDLLNGGGEDYESELITISGLTVDGGGDSNFQGGKNYDATDSSGDTVTLRISDNSFYVGEPIPGGSVTFEGVLSQFNGGFGGAREPDEGYQTLPLIDGDLE